jgi:hypothetical protein
MESDGKQNCQWKGCTSRASKHAVVGLNVFEARDDVHISGTPYKPEHFDLCKKHLDLARLQYVHFQDYALGKCPKQVEHDR